MPPTAPPPTARLIPDHDFTPGHTHVAGLRRREYRRLASQLSGTERTDGTTRPFNAPLPRDHALASIPAASSPRDMYLTAPPRAPCSCPTTHRCLISRRWRRWAALHMGHCAQCQAFSLRLHGVAPPARFLLRNREPSRQPPTAWSLDPSCYQQRLLTDIRYGYDPAPVRPVAPQRRRNGPSCWNEWDQMVDYMAKLDAIGCMDPGVWSLPNDAVLSAMHCVVRASDLRAFERDPSTPYPVRTVTDLSATGVNECFARWPFRMGGVEAAVRLATDAPQLTTGTADFSKFFPRLGIGPNLSRVCWVRDPRASTTWRGTGPPSASWRRFQRARRRSKRRIPPFRRWNGLLLGFTLAPAFASAVSGEVALALTAMGIRCSFFVDDYIMMADSTAQCRRLLTIAIKTFEYLGLRCSPAKTKIAKALCYLGTYLDPINRCITVTCDRRHALRSDLLRLRASPSFGTKDLESLLGKLAFVSQVVRGGAAFTARLRRATNVSLRSSSRLTTVTPDMLSDVNWWLDALATHPPGSRIILSTDHVSLVTVKSDSAGDMGWGYVFADRLHFCTMLDSTVTSYHIQWKEMLALVHCAAEYGPLLSHRIVRFGVDNSSVVYAVLRGRSRCLRLQHLLRLLAHSQRRHTFDVLAVHVTRTFNITADALTRFARVQEVHDTLPAGITTAPLAAWHQCQHRSPVTDEPVFCIPLRLHDKHT